MSQLKDEVSSQHDLNIYMYSFEEILDLFDLTDNITPEDLKRAKKSVLMLHPDKSKLSSEYFLFYKKAFDIVLNYYENNNKQNRIITTENTTYDKDITMNNHQNGSIDRNITSVIQEMKPKVFQEKFNELFEKNMIYTKKPLEKNDWFYQEEPIYKYNQAVSKGNINSTIENIKKQNQGIVKYQGVSHLYSSGGIGTNFYDDIDEDGEQNSSYISSDPFSKLKFEDLRKVHKDQTVFSVSENDFSNMKTFDSIDQMTRERGSQNLAPISKIEAEKLLAEQQRIMKEKISQKQHISYLKTKQHEEKNKSFLSNFLRLT